MTIETEMRALVQTSTNGPTALTFVSDAEVPTAGPGEVLIRVTAAGVNFADVMQTRGTYGGGPAAPYVAGFEAAGEVIAVGPNTKATYGIGSHVVGTGRGAFAEYMVMPAAELLPVPAGWSDAAALGMVLNWTTALAALRPLGKVEQGSVVLVHAAVRLADHYGAQVIATASPAKHDEVRALGAAAVFDSAQPDLVAQVLRHTDGVDLVLESVGQTTFGASLAVAKRFSGRIVVFGAASGDAQVSTHDLVFDHQVQVAGLHIQALADHAPDIWQQLRTEIVNLIKCGVYQPGTPVTHDLADGPRVLASMEARLTTGKQALVP